MKPGRRSSWVAAKFSNDELQCKSPERTPLQGARWHFIRNRKIIDNITPDIVHRFAGGSGGCKSYLLRI